MTLEKIMEQLENMGLLGTANDFIAKARKTGVNVTDEKLVTFVTVILISTFKPEEDILKNLIGYAFYKIAEEIVANYNKEN